MNTILLHLDSFAEGEYVLVPAFSSGRWLALRRDEDGSLGDYAGSGTIVDDTACQVCGCEAHSQEPVAVDAMIQRITVAAGRITPDSSKNTDGDAVAEIHDAIAEFEIEGRA